MNKFMILAAGAMMAMVLAIAPAKINVTKQLDSAALVSYSLTLDIVEAEARSRSRSSFSRRSSPSRNASKRRALSGRSSKPAKKYEKGKSPFDKTRATRKANGNQPFTARSGGASGGRSGAVKTTGSKTSTTSRPRQALSQTARDTQYKKQTASLNTPGAKTRRASAQKTRSQKMRTSSRADTRRTRQERNYWRNEAQFQRNMRYSSYNSGGWGYGYYPGYTYHRGWGVYGYGYTRGGLSIVDMMIINSMFGHNRTSGGTTVVNNYASTDGYKAEDVVAVPQGTTIVGTAPSQSLQIPQDDGKFETVAIPAGSTIQEASGGTLIQTPDGQAVLIPGGAEAFSAPTDYEVPVSAQAPQEYVAPAEDSSNTGKYIGFGVLLVVLGGAGYYVVSKRS